MRRTATIRRTAAVVLATAMVGVGAAAPAAAEAVSEDTTTIEVSVVDAQTGEPLAGVCFFPATRSQFTFPDGCRAAEISDEEGAATVTVREGGTYQLFAWPHAADGYGTQWVGHTGGTGDQRKAARIEVPDGGTATAPVVRMDPAGSISGTVTDPDGQPVAFGRVMLGPDQFNVGGQMGWTAINEDGSFTFDGLGPYEWPLLFTTFGVPSQWSGQAVNRYRAERIPVTVGDTTGYDYQLTTGTQVTIVLGDVPDASFVLGLNAQTGDRVGAWSPAFGAFTIPVLGPQPVKFLLDASDFVGGDDFRSARTFVIQSSGEQEISLG
jgi:hypothetical protein